MTIIVLFQMADSAPKTGSFIDSTQYTQRLVKKQKIVD